MKYFIKRDVCADFGAFEIYDETGIEKYLADVYEKCAVGDRYTYKDGSSSSGLVVYENGKFIACNINAGGKKMRILMGVNRNELVCICSGVNWKICGNIAQKSFSVQDVDNTVIAVQKRVFSSTESYELDVYSPSNELLSISVAVCINMLNTVDNPVRQAV